MSGERERGEKSTVIEWSRSSIPRRELALSVFIRKWQFVEYRRNVQ
jgi:hypothetical protein